MTSRLPEDADQRLADAVAHANLPSLLMVLVHLTGDERWLAPPFRPTRGRGMDDNDTGGLSEAVQQQIRDAAVDAIRAAWAGRAPALHSPDEAQLQVMIEVATGEDVIPHEFTAMIAEELGFRPGPLPGAQESTPSTDPGPVDPASPTVLVIGAGASGIAVAKLLQDAGIDHLIVDKADRIGGTWAANRYPGAGVDTPSHLYSFSFAPYAWPTYFADRGHVEDYLREVVSTTGIERSTRLGCEVIAADWDEAAQRWNVRVRDRDGGDEQVLTARFVVSAVGQLNRPKLPDIAGADDFAGPCFHSSQWPDDLEVSGRRVAVVGSGASAMQIVPHIVDAAAEVVIFQRSPQWAAFDPNYFREVSEEVQFLLDHAPFYRRWYRARLTWTYTDRTHAALQADDDWPHPERSISAGNEQHRRTLTAYISGQLADRPDLLARALPVYPPFGKRMLLDNGWFRALTRDHVELVEDRIERIDDAGLVTEDGRHHDVDVVVFATGFQALDYLAPMRITGRDGEDLREGWRGEGARAHLGITVPGAPNLFLMYGPNTNLGHGGSWMWVAEAQARYIVQLIAGAREQGWGAIECLPEVFDRSTAAVDAAHERMIWTHPGMRNWYRNAAGRVVTNMPWRVMDYWHMIHEPDLDDFAFTPVRDA